MADPKSVIVEIKNGLSDVRQQMNLLKQETAGWVSSLSTGVSRMSDAGGAGGGGSSGGSLVASNPKFSPPASQTAGGGSGSMTPYQPMGGNVVANNPSFTPPAGGGGGGGGAAGGGYTGNNSLTKYLTENASSGFLYAAALTSGMLDQPGETVEAQLLMKRTAYFNNQSYNTTRDLQSSLGKQGTIKDKMDVMRGLGAAQSIGVTGPNVTQGANGVGSVAAGVAATSNLLPGAGFEGTMRAFSSMQQARNVNMLRGIGIQLRDENGNLTPPDKIIDSLWKKIVRDYQQAYGSGAMPKERELLIGMQPGNSIDSMLDMYFGNDPMAKQIIANGLLYKAKTGGGAIDKAKLTAMGATTEAVDAFTRRNAAAGTQLGLTANAGASGYTTAANAIATISETVSSNEKMLKILQNATEVNAQIVTALGALSGTPAKGLAALLGLGGKAGAAILGLGGLGALTVAELAALGDDSSGVDSTANGALPRTRGQASSRATDTDWTNGSTLGKITISNTDAKSGRRSFALALLQELGVEPSDQAVNALMAWQQEEGGHWAPLSTVAYNPLNTKYSGGAVARNKNGIKSYGSWEAGVKATAATLTGSQSAERGYDKIISALKSGDQTDIYAAILASKWNGDYTNSGYEGFGAYKSTTDAGKTYNLGGVTLVVNSEGKSADQLWKEFKILLDKEELAAEAANK